MKRLQSLESLFPGLDKIAHWCIEHRLTELEAILDAHIAEARRDGIARHQDRLYENPSAQRRWIKANLDETRSFKPNDNDVDSIDDPRHRVEQITDFWEGIWNATHSSDAAADEAGIPESVRHADRLADLLSQLPRHNLDIAELIVTAENLLRFAKAAKHKSASTDDWRASALINMPLCWWEALAQLWNHCLRRHCIPSRWADVKCAALYKETGGHRILGIAAVAWRLGAKCLVKGMKRWLNTWPSFELAGGLPIRAAASIHTRFRQTWNDSRCRLYRGIFFFLF